jgi:hypothetical protein
LDFKTLKDDDEFIFDDYDHTDYEKEIRDNSATNIEEEEGLDDAREKEKRVMKAGLLFYQKDTNDPQHLEEMERNL